MNKRIEELVVQASEYVNTVYTPPVRSKTPGKMWEDGHVGWHTQFNQKFAQLIVRECADKIGENLVGAVGTHASAYNSAVLKCQNTIKQHFGVE